MKPKVLIISQWTWDRNVFLSSQKEILTPGGPPFFCAPILKKLGCEVSIFSPFGQDFPKSVFAGLKNFPSKPFGSLTLRFENTYEEGGKREQKVKNFSTAFPSLKIIPSNFCREQNLLIFAPLLPYCFPEVLLVKKFFPQALRLIMPQGFFRKVVPGGKIIPRDWEEADLILPLFPLVVLSELDGEKIAAKAAGWSRRGSIVVVTRAEKGCLLYEKGKEMIIRGFPIGEIENPTGVGDIFGAAFVWAYFQTKDSLLSANFANALAAYSLRRRQDGLKYGKNLKAAVLAFAQKRGRRIFI